MTETLRNGKRKAVLEALAAGNTRRAAARLAGIDSSTLYAWMKADPALSSAVESAEAGAEREAVAAVKAAFGESWQAAAWFLERRYPAEYGRRDKLVVFRELVKEVADLSTEDLEAELAAARGVAPTPDA